MKRIVYYTAFAILGALLGLLLHALVEIAYIKLLLSDYDRFGFGLKWVDWERIHMVFVVVIVVGFTWLGFRWGKKFWRILYVEHKYSKRWGIKLKQNF